jgi:hypothetical protein
MNGEQQRMGVVGIAAGHGRVLSEIRATKSPVLPNFLLIPPVS